MEVTRGKSNWPVIVEDELMNYDIDKKNVCGDIIDITYSGLDCGGNTYVTYDENGENRKPYTDDCTNVNGEDMSRSADYTYGLQITYYFR